MENIKDRATLYQQLLSSSFDQILQVLPSKHSRLRDIIKKHRGKTEYLTLKEYLADDKQNNILSANKYFAVFKLGLDLGINRVSYVCLYSLQELISHKFLDGNCLDYT